MTDEPDPAAMGPTDPATAASAPHEDTVTTQVPLQTGPDPSAYAGGPGGAPSHGGAPPRRRRWLWPGIAAALIIAAILMGVAIGYAFWGSDGKAPLRSQANGGPARGFNAVPHNNGNGNGNGSPYGFGNGAPYGYGEPYGNGSGSGGSSSGAGSSGSGAPSNVSSIAASVSPGLVDINVTLANHNGQAAATGIVLTPTGEVLTNNHVIQGASSISATDVGNGKTYTATVVGYDRSLDIAVLQLNGASGLQTAKIGDSSTVAVGQAVVAIGNAGGAGGKPSAAGGSVIALDQHIVADGAGGSEGLSGLIEVNAAVQPGDSGGPLVNSAGKAIGVNVAASAGYSFRSSGGRGYAIPINQALAVATQIENGVSSSTVHVGPTAFLGVELAIPAGRGEFGQGFGGQSGQGGSTVSGATVAGVVPGSPAAGAGLASGDVITSLGGQSVGSATALTSIVAGHRPGDSVPVVWVDQSGKQHTATVRLASGPAQ